MPPASEWPEAELSKLSEASASPRRIPAQRSTSEGDTKRRLLDAAERIFAERGFEGASMRAITREAGTSLSAANYHFGSKEALLAETLRRYVGPLNQRRLARLALLEREGAPGVEAILQAFLEPVFDEPGEQAGLRKVSIRLYSDPPERVEWLKAELFSELREHFEGALRRALPDADEARLALAFQFTVGVMLHVIAGHHLTDAATGSADPDALSQAIVCYASAGLEALVGPADDEVKETDG